MGNKSCNQGDLGEKLSPVDERDSDGNTPSASVAGERSWTDDEEKKVVRKVDFLVLVGTPRGDTHHVTDIALSLCLF
jgi:hypothetical protein